MNAAVVESAARVARRDLDDWTRRQLANRPPLTDDQRQRIAFILNSGGTE